MVLPILYKWLQARGVVFTKKHLESLDDLSDEYDLIVNCSGVGARWLVGDEDVEPISGHVLRVEAPGVNMVMADCREESWAYIIPRREDVVLGSVDIPGNWDTTVHSYNTNIIMERCMRLCPAIQVGQTSRQCNSA